MHSAHQWRETRYDNEIPTWEERPHAHFPTESAPRLESCPDGGVRKEQALGIPKGFHSLSERQPSLGQPPQRIPTITLLSNVFLEN
jgi:hypothetical protein